MGSEVEMDLENTVYLIKRRRKHVMRENHFLKNFTNKKKHYIRALGCNQRERSAPFSGLAVLKLPTLVTEKDYVYTYI